LLGHFPYPAMRPPIAPLSHAEMARLEDALSIATSVQRSDS